MAFPEMSTYNLKALCIGASEKYLAYYSDKSEDPGKGSLNLHFYPSLILHKSIVKNIQAFPKTIQIDIKLGYLIVLTSTFQVFSLPDMNMM